MLKEATFDKAALASKGEASQLDQASWGAIILIYAIGVLGATSISQAIPVAAI